MSLKRVDDLFEIIQGHQITEEEIYNSFGDVPIFSGNNTLKGYVDTAIVSEEDLPCITYPTKGKVGNFFIKDKIFEANNTAILILKDEWKGKINLNWYISQISPKVKKYCNSKSGVGYIGKQIMERITVKIPEKKTQNKIGSFYNRIQNFKKDLDGQIEEIEKYVKNKRILNYPLKKTKLIKVFEIKGGNNGLTEEFIYYNQPNNKDEAILVLSSATIKNNSMGIVSRNAKPDGKNLKLFQGPCILVARNGNAGKMTYISDQEFTINDHAYVLKLRAEWKNKINFRWFINQYQELFYIIASKSDNGTFNKTYAKEQQIKIPEIDLQDKIAKNLFTADTLIQNLEKCKDKIEILLEHQIV